MIYLITSEFNYINKKNELGKILKERTDIKNCLNLISL